jgi:hypothetical protein
MGEKMKLIQILSAVAAMVLLTIGVFPQANRSSSTTDEILGRPMQDTDEHLSTTAQRFIRDLSGVSAPGGLVQVFTCEADTSKPTPEQLGASLREALDALVSLDRRYRWQVDDGVINLLPASDQPALLGTQIARFSAKKVLSAREALSHLLALDEMKSAMEKLGLKAGIALFVSPGSPHPKAFSVSVKDVTLRQALNAIARAQGTAIWEYIETHCQGRNEVVIRF